jgi:DNA-binding response OmpR family regulator
LYFNDIRNNENRNHQYLAMALKVASLSAGGVIMKRILVVDDDPDTLGFLKILLQRQGYEISTAQDGGEALELLETQSIDLILADVARPHLNGYELCQRIKNAPDSRLLLTPVILMSGRTLDSDIRYAKSLGADDYLPKPLDVDDLLAVVQGKLLAVERLQNLFDREANGAEVITLIINEKLVRLDYRQHRVWVGDQEVELTARKGQHSLAFFHRLLVDTID